MLIEKVKNTIKKYEMINKNDIIIIGVSGGPDSMCLLHVLLKIRKDYNLKLIAAHVNHCLRGHEADTDEDFVKDFCAKNNVEFCSIRADISKISSEKHISCEEAGRFARYEFFKSTMKNTGAAKIALAHNANDNAETILMHFFRGSGPEGLCGIKPVRDNIYIRPLINIKRCEIEKYCLDNVINPRIDKTNLQRIYSRNKIRLDLIPYIQDNFNKNIIDTSISNSEIIKKDNDFICDIARRKSAIFVRKEKDKVIISKQAFDEHEAVLTRIIRNAISDLRGNVRNIEKNHVDDIIKVQKSETGKKINIASGVHVYNDYGSIIITKEDLGNLKDTYADECKLNIGSNLISQIGLKIKLELASENNMNTYIGKENIKYFDFDKVNKVTLRFRKDGDKYIPFGMIKYKKLKDEFIDLKLPRFLRDSIPLVCFNDEIAWIVGYKTSDNFKITKETEKILKITVEREELK